MPKPINYGWNHRGEKLSKNKDQSLTDAQVAIIKRELQKNSSTERQFQLIEEFETTISCLRAIRKGDRFQWVEPALDDPDSPTTHKEPELSNRQKAALIKRELLKDGSPSSLKRLSEEFGYSVPHIRHMRNGTRYADVPPADEPTDHAT